MTPADAREIGDRLERKWWFKLVTETIKERDEAIKERDEAIEQLRQAKAEKLKAVKVLVGADECCEACRLASEDERRFYKQVLKTVECV